MESYNIYSGVGSFPQHYDYEIHLHLCREVVIFHWFVVFHCMIAWFIHSAFWSFLVLGVLWIMLLWTFFHVSFGGHKHLFLFGIYPAVELLGYKVCVYMVGFSRYCHFSEVVVSVYTPTTRIWEFWLFCIFVNTWYWLSLSC